jgi:hypothetical protein
MERAFGILSYFVTFTMMACRRWDDFHIMAWRRKDRQTGGGSARLARAAPPAAASAQLTLYIIHDMVAKEQKIVRFQIFQLELVRYCRRAR